jgi:hypothetical protein
LTSAAPGAAWQEPEQPDPILVALAGGPGARGPDPDPNLGDFCVNAAAWERIAQLRRAGDVAEADAAREQLRRGWLSEQAAKRGGLATYGLPRVPSLDTRQHRRRQVPRPKLSEGVKARQRDRYKRAMADALDAFAWEHRPRRTIDRDRPLRPRWLDHLTSCTVPGRCSGCRTIPARAAPRWHRRRQGRDYLEPASMTPTEWLADRAAALRGCREAVALRDRVCGGTLIVPQSCRVRTCPDCEQARQVQVIDRYQLAVEAIPAGRAKFATFTIRNRPRDELAAGLDHLRDSMEKLRRRAVWKGGRCRDRSLCRQPLDPERPGWRLPHQPVAAALQTVEVTPWTPERPSWHPHLHAIIDAPFIDQGELSDAWAAITGDSFIVDIRAVATYATEHHEGDTRAALAELLKYAAKPHPAYLSERDPAPIAELLLALRGRRMTSATGYLHHLDPDLEYVLTAGPSCSLLVLVQPDQPGAEPYRAPRTCPLHGGVADWTAAGYVSRALARKQDARAGPRRQVLALLDSTKDAAD